MKISEMPKFTSKPNASLEQSEGKFKVFSYTRITGGNITEYSDGKKWWFEYREKDVIRTLELYDIEENIEKYNRLYLGYTMEEILASGKDILSEKLLENGEVSYSDVKGILNPVTKNAYCFLGGAASHGGITVDTMGVAYPQLSGRDREPAPQFSPISVDAKLGLEKPRQYMLGKEYPLLCSIHCDNTKTLEFLYFVEPGDCDRDPILWIRAKWYNNSNPEFFNIKYFASSFSREAVASETELLTVEDKLFLEALSDTAAHWIKFSESGSYLSLPEKELERVARGSLAFTAITFTADKPHYGHKFYGKELHDNFPPNYIWSIEAAILLGHAVWASRIFEYMLNYALNDEGRFTYRQGNKLNLGSSATEYGMLLFLANRYKKQLGLLNMSQDTKNKLCGMGNIILAHCLVCDEFGGKTLVKMCAEADNNVRVNVYLNNNLWAIRGLEALSSLLYDTEEKNYKEYSDMAKTLRENINNMIDEHGLKNTRFGKLPPFRFGYPADPYTLSNCNDTFRALSEQERYDYFEKKKDRQLDVTSQDLTENTYANYRYYPEILSSMLLPEEYSDAIVRMRENIGGELLGMTRFRHWIDNWPVLNYARFLIETDRIEKFLTLLYAHTAHHGHPDLICYYEQVKLTSEINMPDCVPSLLTTPTMTGWMFAYEKMDNTLLLLGALPKDWYNTEFEVRNIGYSDGSVCISSDGNKISVDFENPCPENTVIVFRNKTAVNKSDISLGSEYITKISGNKLKLVRGLSHAEFIIN